MADNRPTDFTGNWRTDPASGSSGTSEAPRENALSLLSAPGFSRASSRYKPVLVDEVKAMATLIDASGALEMLEDWRDEDGRPVGGRPSEIEDRTILILTGLLANNGDALHVWKMMELILYRLTPTALDYLGLPELVTRDGGTLVAGRLPTKHERSERKPRRRRELRRERAQHKAHRRFYSTKVILAWYKRVWRGVKRILAPMDPFPETQHWKRYTAAVFFGLRDTRDPEFVAKRRRRLMSFNNRLLWTVVDHTPQKVWSDWDGSIAFDGTFVSGPWRATNSEGHASSSPDAGWYNREHFFVDDLSDTQKEMKSKWGWDLALAIASPSGPGQRVPLLPLGMSFDQPSVDPNGNIMMALENVMASDLPKGYAVGDRIYYPHMIPEKFQIPLREAGYRIVGDLRRDTVGLQGTYKGLLLVDGSFFDPAMPQPLIDATPDYIAGRITEKDWRTHLARRAEMYLSRVHDTTPDGAIKFKCAASGPGATLDCPLRDLLDSRRERSEIAAQGLPEVEAIKALRDKADEREKAKKTLRVPATTAKFTAPKEEEAREICTNKHSVSVPLRSTMGTGRDSKPFNIAKYLQTGPSWESEEWAAIYHTARNSIEGTNAHIKDGNGVSLAQHSKRLLRSFAGQAFLVGFIVLSHSLRVLNSFLERMERADLDGPPPTPPRTLIGDDDWESLSEETGKGRDPAVPPLAA